MYIPSVVSVADHKQRDLAASKEKEQLQVELNRVSRAMDQQKEELCGMQEKLTALREDSSEQKELRTKGKQKLFMRL